MTGAGASQNPDQAEAKGAGGQGPESNPYLSQNHTTLDASKSKTKHNILIDKLQVHKTAKAPIGPYRQKHPPHNI